MGNTLFVIMVLIIAVVGVLGFFKVINPKKAFLLSLLFPGLGQMYNGRTILGTLFVSFPCILVLLAYIYIFQWAGCLDHEITSNLILFLVLNWVGSTTEAYETAKKHSI